MGLGRARSRARCADGSELELRDRTLRVLHRPGHSPSDTVFLDEERGILLAADHLIAHISSNPLLARPLDAGEDYCRATARRRWSPTWPRCERTRAMELSLVLPGHGQPITDHVALIDERFRMHRRRAEKIIRLIAGAAAHARTRSPRSCGATSPSRRPT